jgi:hypothetical protein
MLDLRVALARLPDDQREALVLIGAAGHSYAEAADICGCAIGTIKSRVNRARRSLAKMLCIDPVPDFGEADQVMPGPIDAELRARRDGRRAGHVSSSPRGAAAQPPR